MPTIKAGGIRQYYREEGNPALPTVMLAHPVGFDLGVWDRLVPLLTHSHHVIRYDMRGHGGTESPLGDYSVEMLAADALALAQGLDLGPVHFYGVSLGGLVGLWLAAYEPGALTTLTVSNLSAKLPLSSEEWNRRIDHARHEGVGAFVPGVRERMFSAATRDADAPIFHTLMCTFQATDPIGYAGGLAALRDADLNPALHRIETPTLVIHGRHDGAVPADHPTHIAQQVRAATLTVVDGGHLSPVESPSDVADALRRHMQSHWGPRVQGSAV